MKKAFEYLAKVSEFIDLTTPVLIWAFSIYLIIKGARITLSDDYSYTGLALSGIGCINITLIAIYNHLKANTSKKED